MIKENCKCGACFEINSGNVEESFRYADFLKAHAVCRNVKLDKIDKLIDKYTDLKNSSYMIYEEKIAFGEILEDLKSLKEN